jgi:hypothetical protein
MCFHSGFFVQGFHLFEEMESLYKKVVLLKLSTLNYVSRKN